MCKKLIKNSQPFGRNFQKTLGGIFFWLTLYIYNDDSGGTRNLLFLRHQWGIIISKSARWSAGFQHWGARAPRTVRDGVASSAKEVPVSHLRKTLPSKSCLLVARAPKCWPLLVCKVVLWNSKNLYCVREWKQWRRLTCMPAHTGYRPVTGPGCHPSPWRRHWWSKHNH